MGVYSSELKSEVRLERMRPAQIEKAREKYPSVYVPFGAMEWHGFHNPVGLDALKSHELLVGLAAQKGGVVYPSVYFGSGGEHTLWPHTMMVTPALMKEMVKEMLFGFQGDGYQSAVLYAGHAPNATEYLAPAVEDYKNGGGAMRVLLVRDVDVPGMGGDHGAFVETSLLLHLLPGTVEMGEITNLPGPEPDPSRGKHNWMFSDSKEHPCYGLVGVDPRGAASAQEGKKRSGAFLSQVTKWLDGQVSSNPADWSSDLV